jgi:hypothetical protein
VVVEFHKPLTVDVAGGRKQLAAAAETAVRDGVVRALTGGSAGPAAHTDETLIEALEEGESEAEETV